MNRVFTEYVQALAAAGASGEPPEDDLFDSVWKKLRDILVSELRKRSLWTSPPNYLGVFGYTSWSEVDALEELLTDCFAFIFVERLESLKGQLKVKKNIEGLIFLSLRNFLYDTQKKHDPLGFRVFVTLEAATLQALKTELYIMAGDAEATLRGKNTIKNETTLAFKRGADAAEAQDIHLGQLVEAWTPFLLPDLVLAKGARRQAVIAELTTRLLQLSTQGVEVFRFKDLITPLKKHVRAYWQAIWWQGEGEVGFEDSDDELQTLVRLARPDPGPEEREIFRKVLACVEEAPDHHDGTEEEKSWLQAVWKLLRTCAAEPGKHRVPSQRQTAETLGIPRHRLPRLFDTLKSWLGACRERLHLPRANPTTASQRMREAL